MKFVVLRKKVILKTLIFCLAFALCFVSVGLTDAAAVFMNKTVRKLPIYCVDKTEKEISISFDASWGADNTLNIMNVLKEKKVVGNFFVVSFWADNYKTELKTLAESGVVEIGTHSATHSHMSKQSKKQIETELSSSKKIIEDITGKPVTLFRPPYGDYNDTLINTCFEMNLFPIQWDVDSLDWKNLSATDIASRVLKGVKNGSIILMHNDGKNTLQALPLVIDELIRRNYTFKFISDLIYKDHYTIDHTGKQIKNQ